MSGDVVALALLGVALGAVQGLTIFVLQGIRQSLHALRDHVQTLTARLAVLEATVARDMARR